MTETYPLTPDQLAAFREDGYLTLRAIAPPEEVEQLRDVFRRLFEGRVGWRKGAQFDLAGTDDADGPAVLPQILNPVEFAPELRDTKFRANALAVARQLLGEEAEPWFEHAILKPPHYGAATPWHQDEAHRDDPGCHYEQISIWMPLNEATEANGCMSYIPGSHRGPILEHRSPNNDPRVTALECIGSFDATRAVSCPLPAGGAAVHHCRTLHGAGPNRSDLPRQAYILAFRGPIRPDPTFHGYEWNSVKHTAAQDRRDAWDNRGGAAGKAFRKIGGGLRRTAQRIRNHLAR